MIDFDAVIGNFGPKAVSFMLLNEAADDKALEAVRNSRAPNRSATLVEWLRSYSVFRGIDKVRRTPIAEAVLTWADSLDGREELVSADAICHAHTSLMAACDNADRKGRRFPSLASKALWLCYPDSVPIFDSYAQRALHVLSKLDSRVPLIGYGTSEYEQFVRVWTGLYCRYQEAIAAVDMRGYPFRSRVFDGVLWIIGRPSYLVGKGW
jgi:hypothetical protein